MSYVFLLFSDPVCFHCRTFQEKTVSCPLLTEWALMITGTSKEYCIAINKQNNNAQKEKNVFIRQKDLVLQSLLHICNQIRPKFFIQVFIANEASVDHFDPDKSYRIVWTINIPVSFFNFGLHFFFFYLSNTISVWKVQREWIKKLVNKINIR